MDITGIKSQLEAALSLFEGISKKDPKNKQYKQSVAYNRWLIENIRPVEVHACPKDASIFLPEMQQQKCFSNAANFVIANPDRFDYVEGFGSFFVNIEHAWVYDKKLKRHYDPTREAFDVNYHSYGETLRLSVDQLTKYLLSTEKYSFFTPQHFLENVYEKL